MPCGCPSTGVVAIDQSTHDAYHRLVGGPATCARLCWCGRCPTFPAQAAATERLREQEYAARDRRDGEKAARQERRAA